MAKLNSLRDLYIHELQDLFDAENQLTKALPQMEQAASSEELKAAFREHLEVTQNQIQRLEQIFQGLDEEPGGEKCKAMQGLIAEAQDLLKEDAEPDVLDAALIGAAQRVEHYEMAGYGTARTFAQRLGEDEAASLLQETLEEEEMTDKKLTRIAEGQVNPQADQ
ncbi:MAG TPA: ferritin-like domain-containing protein [Ardenticatenaceae bacterium]